jgi:hypothetical protein
MKLRNLGFAFVAIVALISVPVGRAQEDQTPQGQAPAAPSGREGARRKGEGRGRGVFGKISAITKDSIEIIGGDGTKVSVKLTSNTEFRKDRQPAKIGEFKVGDSVIVRIDSDSAPASGATALVVASVPQGFAGRGGGGGGQGFMLGTMGQDFVAGEVKSVDAPKLTVLRTDNVTQTLELNEETSLRRGRDSITMADIQPGDHIMARGAVANDVFVPKSLNVITPEQWKRMQEFMNEGGRPAGGPPQAAAPPATQQKPPEQPN